MSGDYRANIRNYLLFVGLRGAATAASVVLWVIYLQRHFGYSLTQVALLDVVFWISIFTFEVPTGVVADRFGRKASLAAGTILASGTWLLFTLSGQFWFIAGAQVIGGLAATFHSGAGEPFLFESMQALGRADEYAQISGRAHAVEVACTMAFSLLAGWLASVDLVLPIRASSLFWAAALIPVLLLAETGGAPQTEGRRPLAHAQILSRSVAALRAHGALRWGIAYLAILGSISFYAATFLQPYAAALNLSTAAIGGVMVVLQAMTIAGSLAVPRLQKAVGTQGILYGAPVLLAACLLLVGVAPGRPVLALALAAGFLFALAPPVLLAVIQPRVPDEARATVLSIQSLFATAFMTVTEPPLGRLSDAFGVHVSYLGMACLVALFCVLLVWRGRRWLSDAGPGGRRWPAGERDASP